jgi:hypothetical protein
MPTYVLTNTETNKTYEEFCSWDNLQTMLKDNPHLKQELTTAALVATMLGLAILLVKVWTVV